MGTAPGEKITPPIMRGRLRDNLAFWSSFCQSTLVLSWIASGFPLLWQSGQAPCPFSAPNHQSARTHSEFIDSQILDYLMAESVMEWPNQPHIVCPLGVDVKAGGKKRMIYDARYINSHLVIPSFRYEDLSTLSEILQPGDFMITTDFSRGYHHVDIDPRFYQFLGFEWRGKFYVFTSLPFGLAPACWAFTKIIRELHYKWRKQGIRCSGYIDDGIFPHQIPQALIAISHIIKCDCESCGLILNLVKTDFQPSQQKQYIGAIINTIGSGSMVIPFKRMQALTILIESALRSPHRCHYKTLERITGSISSMYRAFGPLTRSMSLSLHYSMKMSNAQHVCLSAEAISDLQFWLHGAKQFQGILPIWPDEAHPVTIHTDAAGTSSTSHGGWAGWMLDPTTGEAQDQSFIVPPSHNIRLDQTILVARGIWAHGEDDESSTFLELYTVLLTLQSLLTVGHLAGKFIRLFTDNANVECIINRAGSKTPRINSVAKELVWFTMLHKIRLRSTWIPRDLNQLADFFSKIEDSSDWKLNPTVFSALADLFATSYGPLQIDLFASHTNYQLPSFYSLYWTPSARGVDSFNFWWDRHCYAYPPYNQIARMIRHGRSCGSRILAILPITPAARWWYLVMGTNGKFLPYIQSCVVLQQRYELLLSGVHKYAPCPTRRGPKWGHMAVVMDFQIIHGVSIPIPSTITDFLN